MYAAHRAVANKAQTEVKNKPKKKEGSTKRGVIVAIVAIGKAFSLCMWLTGPGKPQ